VAPGRSRAGKVILVAALSISALRAYADERARCTVADTRFGAAVAELQSGDVHTCARLVNGEVWCWGGNSHRELGDLAAETGRATRVPEVEHARRIATGEHFTCALSGESRVQCWGRNQSAQLGAGSVSASLGPTTVLDLRGAVADLAAGGDHACVLYESGGVACWGRNDFGQLGDGTRIDRRAPIDVRGIPPARAIAAGEDHACAVAAGGAVYCWGRNHRAQLGRRTQSRDGDPARVRGLRDAVAIASGPGDHTCARTSGGKVFCWGRNGEGQVGNGANGDALFAQQLQNLGAVSAIAVGEDHSCALDIGGALWCWGKNRRGQLGDDTTHARSLPRRVPRLSAVLAVAAGEDHTCVLLPARASRANEIHAEPAPFPTPELSRQKSSRGATTSGSTTPERKPKIPGGGRPRGFVVRCFGGNEEGQLGCGRVTGTLRPTRVAELEPARALVGGDDHSCALLANGRARCWGGNEEGELGSGRFTPSLHPVEVAGLRGAVQLASGEDFVCARTRDGNAWCWGRNDQGQLGDGSRRRSAKPMRVQGLSPATQIAAGEKHACAIVAGGEVRCWGDNRGGQLGDGTRTSRPRPTRAIGVRGAGGLALGDRHSCARLTDGRVRCWGANAHGQLGREASQDDATALGDTTRAYEVRGLEDVVQIAAGEDHTCGVRADGDVWCWGSNAEGQLGDGTLVDRVRPVRVAGIQNARQVVAGEEHSCALTREGAAWCWGANARGQLGDGTRTNRSTPVRVPDAPPYARLGAGEGHTCAIDLSGGVHCWGGQAAVPELWAPPVTDEVERPFEADRDHRLGARAYAELRLRDHLDATEPRTRNRFRIRTRLSAELAWRGWFLGLGVRTASDGAAGLTSDNFTVDGKAFPIPVVNLAYLGFKRETPRWGVLAAAGYIANPFQTNPLLRNDVAVGRRTVQSIRVFDADYTPLGASVLGSAVVGPGRLFATTSLWALGGQFGAASDLMSGAQTGFVTPRVLVAGAYYHLGRPGAELATFATKEGNTALLDAHSKSTGALRRDFGLASLTSRLDLERLAGFAGASLQLEYTRNLLAPSRNNSVYAQLTGRFGTKLSWLLDAWWVEADGAFAALADSDRSFTDVAGASTAIAFAFTRHFALTLNYFFAQRMLRDEPALHRFFLSFTSRVRL
jgi:alpha-tubulin suppressor-like RCC1 family protein